MRERIRIALSLGALLLIAACGVWLPQSVPAPAASLPATPLAVTSTAVAQPPTAAPSLALPPSATPASPSTDASATPASVTTAASSPSSTGAAPAPSPSSPTATSSPTPRATAAPPRGPLPSGESRLFVAEYPSALMGQRMPFMIYLPPGYDAGTRRYPVVYLLHGWGGDHGEWSWFETQHTADRMIRAGEIPPLIIACPEGDKAYWFNHFGGPRWGDYAAVEFVDHVDNTFRTLVRRESRAIGGLSMGGQGALSIALRHPERFAIVGMRSPSWRRPGDPDTPAFFGNAAYYSDYDALALLQRSAPALPLTTFFIHGHQDQWNYRTDEVIDWLKRRGAAVDRRVFPGEHEAEFFKSRVEEDLRYYGAHLATGS